MRKNIIRHFRGALLALSTLAFAFLLPLTSWASTSNHLQSPSVDASFPSTSYYLQNNPRYNPVRQRGSQLSIKTRKSSRAGHSTGGGDSEYRFIKRRRFGNREAEMKRVARRASLAVLAAGLAATKFRASRKSRVVRTATPFGRIKNHSLLGNGVSLIRVCVALEFDEGDIAGGGGRDGGGVGSLLDWLCLEEKELNAKVALLTKHQLRGNIVDSRGSLVSKLKQKARGEFMSNVASTLLRHRDVMKYGSIESTRVPFAHEAVKLFGQVSKEERKLFDGRAREQLRRPTEQSATKDDRPPETYAVVTMLLAIKGDRTAAASPFGTVRRRDVARALSRIAADATTDDCLVRSEVLSTRGSHVFTREEVLEWFPELVPLT
eukprot:CAMPEP_0172577702 /NCGR_PEP_ID=MMETSP1067-20121228/138368_1 /TAXON_ID=265564 ORGANISM="Thalassiosira punctigera, Strain Tpunct2005C2" /NCGR_SAMPLE_ID=MMETSP1067 /ASSEMBLY_ACC=CAM_ASM_000444 /LENGTH=377 /DNA_ID=CAMNT_0013370393 /DNA_START=362 /DNA_END=1495 /DNA_ORIENTATION=+